MIVNKLLYRRVVRILLSSVIFSLPSCDKGASIDNNNKDLIFGTVADIDGNVYNTIKIGNQEWVTENLRTMKYNDGILIPLATDREEFDDLTTPGYCYYNNTTNSDSINKFGALYNWYAINTGKLVPAGWHVPTDEEWKTLENYLVANGYNYDGTPTGNLIAKAMAAKTDWNNITATGTPGNNLNENNSSGFSGLPGGNCCGGGCGGIGDYGYWWSTTELSPGASDAFTYYLNYNQSYLSRDGDAPKRCGFSVRFLKNVN